MSREPVAAAACGPSPPLRACVPACLRAYPKVIDFGVARVDGGEAGLTTAHTMTGQIIGTVQYMSPEQCDGDPNAVDVRSDVYSLGVILYELLTGTLPYHATSLSLVAATRAIREQEPARPSTINRKLRGDVETVVLKALEKDRTRRYQSAEALARDIRHVLNREPIEARRATVLERAVKWAVRHPVVVTIGACAIVVLATGGTIILAYWYAMLRPDYCRPVDDSRDAILCTVTGLELHRWQGDTPGAITFARYSRGTFAARESSLALVGFSCRALGDYASGLYAFNCERPNKDLEWTGTVATGDVPAVLQERETIQPGSFDARALVVANVFDPPPGDEIIVAHQSTHRTQTSLRVYSRDGRVIWETWADFQVQAMYYLADARLLIVGGFDARVLWQERGVSCVRDPNRHPLVVIAIRPIRNRFGSYVAADHPVEALRPLWARCLLPPDVAEMLSMESESTTISVLPTTRSRFSVSTCTYSRPSCAVGWVFDEGGPQDDPPIFAGEYTTRMSLPRNDPRWLPTPGRDIYWGELPPIIVDPNRPGDPNDPTSEDLRRHFRT